MKKQINISTNHLLVIIPTLDSLHCEKKLLCFSLIGKVKAYLVALRKHSECASDRLKLRLWSGSGIRCYFKQNNLHLQGKCGKMFELLYTGTGRRALVSTVTFRAVLKEKHRK